MTIEDAKQAINEIKEQGLTDEQIAKSLYVMYEDKKIDLEQLKALLTLVGYSLNEDFLKNEKN